MTAIDLLCEIIAQGGKASAATFSEQPDFKTLLHGGYVRESGVVQAVACYECEDPHDAEIVFEADCYGYFCPDIGFVPVERAMVAGLQPDLPAIVSGLADAFECKRRRTTPLNGATWRVGVVASEGGDLSLYFHPTLKGEQDVTDLMAALSREVRSQYRLVLTTDGTLPVSHAKVLRLNEVVDLNSEQAGFTVLADPHDIVEAPHRMPGGAPNIHKKSLAPLIHSRMQDGSALPGRNEEAKAIWDILLKQNPNANPPSLPTVKRYLTEARGRS